MSALGSEAITRAATGSFAEELDRDVFHRMDHVRRGGHLAVG
jgi:hypothetical protein